MASSSDSEDGFQRYYEYEGTWEVESVDAPEDTPEDTGVLSVSTI